MSDSPIRMRAATTRVGARAGSWSVTVAVGVLARAVVGPPAIAETSLGRCRTGPKRMPARQRARASSVQPTAICNDHSRSIPSFVSEAERDFNHPCLGRELRSRATQLQVHSPRRFRPHLDAAEREAFVARRQDFERRLLSRKTRGQALRVDAGCDTAVSNLAFRVDPAQVAFSVRSAKRLLDQVHPHEIESHADRHDADASRVSARGSGARRSSRCRGGAPGYAPTTKTGCGCGRPPAHRGCAFAVTRESHRAAMRSRTSPLAPLPSVP